MAPRSKASTGTHTKHNNQNKTKKTSSSRPPKRPAAIVFDADARRAHLVGFADRKRQRRAFGLAMQKVKDRKARLASRAEQRAAAQEHVLDMEARKEAAYEKVYHASNKTTVAMIPLPRDALPSVKHQQRPRTDTKKKSRKASDAMDEDSVRDKNDNGSSRDDTSVKEDVDDTTRVETYNDSHTQQQWGGQVIVTTSTHIPGSDDDNDDDDMTTTTATTTRQAQSSLSGNHRQRQPKPKSRDVAQEYAGKVDKFLAATNGGNKTSSNNKRRGKRSGKHGAAHMKGIGSSAHLKVATKMLKRSTEKGGSSSNSGHGGKGKKRRK